VVVIILTFLSKYLKCVILYIFEALNLPFAHIFKSQFFKNSVWTLADVVSYPLLMIVATPFFINKLGSEQYGLWMLINVIVQVMNGLNFGLGDSTIKEVSKYKATNAFERLNSSFNRNLSLSIILLLCCLILGFISTKVIAYNNWFHIKPADMQKAMLTLFLFAFAAGLKFVEMVFLSVFKGLQRFDIAARLSILSRLSVLCSSILVVWMGYDVLMIVKVTLLVNAFNLIVQSVVVIKYSPVVSLTPRFKKNSFTGIFENNGWYWLQSVIALLGFLSDRIIIGQLSDLKTLGYYSIAALVGSQIHNVLLTFGAFVFPKVSTNEALKRGSNEVYYLSRFLIAGLGWSVITVLLVFGGFIFQWWLGEAIFAQSYRYIKLYLAFASVILLIIVPYYFLNGSKFVRVNSLFEIILRGSHMVSMYFSYIYFGMEGLLWALIITTILNIPFQYYLFNRLVLKEYHILECVYPLLPALFIVGLVFSNTFWVSLLISLFAIITFNWVYYSKAAAMVKNFMLKSNEQN
jgi:O-antigen/teichoic acid export membrane protein